MIVGIESDDRHRSDEYSPFFDPELGGGGADRYLHFLVHTLKPTIDSSFATHRDGHRTAIFGSSLGGLLALYAHFRAPQVFGLAAAFSPAVSFADHAILGFVRAQSHSNGRIYLDAGTHEFGFTPGFHPSTASLEYVRRIRRFRDALTGIGYREGHDLTYRELFGGRHSEHSWAQRLPGALGALLSANTAEIVSDGLWSAG